MKKVQLANLSIGKEAILSLKEKTEITGGWISCGVPGTQYCLCEKDGVWYEYCCGEDGCKNAFPEI